MNQSITANAPVTSFVIGHRNPDTDSICAAIAYAALKEAGGEQGYVAARCGNTNARTDAVLARFHHAPPVYLTDVAPRVRNVMSTAVISAPGSATCAEVLDLINRHDITILPVTTAEHRLLGTISLAQLGHFFIPQINEPRLMRQVNASLASIARALRAKMLSVHEENALEELYLRVGAMDINTFWKFCERENISAAQSIVIVGDRRDIQECAVEVGVRLLVVSGNLPVPPDIISAAKARRVSIISSPYDSATTALVVRTASIIDPLIDRRAMTLGADATLAEARRHFARNGPHAMLVTTEDGLLLGLLTKSDLLREPAIRLVLVDHNELSQAVAGADQVQITEIIDHHRLGSPVTSQPILFINEPVGSTCTIVADLYRRRGVVPTPDLAGLMMSGIVADTLWLKSPTSTPKDAELLGWLEQASGVDPRQLSELIFSSGSLILSSSPDEVVISDFKIYNAGKSRFAVSQVEEVGFDHFRTKVSGLAAALDRLCADEELAFAALLVTDVNRQSSLLLLRGEPEIARRISYAHAAQDDMFDLPGVVSRKKQLIPYLFSIVREMSGEGAPMAGQSGRFRKQGG